MIMQGLGSFTTAAGTMATAGANVTQAFASVAVASSDGAINVATEAWEGIDLIDLTVAAEKGELILDDNSAFRDDLDSAAGHVVWHTRGELREQAIAIVEKASLSIPHQAISKSFMNISGVYQQLYLPISLLESCLWKVQWLYVDVGFWLRWANPILEVVGIDFKSEEEQIRTKMDAIVQQLKALFPSHEQPVTFLQPVAPIIRKRW